MSGYHSGAPEEQLHPALRAAFQPGLPAAHCLWLREITITPWVLRPIPSPATLPPSAYHHSDYQAGPAMCLYK
ncbi:hypothetical protein EYF80_009643 [Liparis tanakae]|uniref:Uncharacterized protein n=1 Tax=Liparis tanakae TaxID=230148 RepID=A0A4Z2IS67_9TELE|nr:hypothetical protein EYF80_009643 [Liparis tanakae]